MLMVTARNPPMVQVRLLQTNQPKVHPIQQKGLQQRAKALRAVLLNLLEPLKAKQNVLPLPDNSIPVNTSKKVKFVGEPYDQGMISMASP